LGRFQTHSERCGGSTRSRHIQQTAVSDQRSDVSAQAMMLSKAKAKYLKSLQQKKFRDQEKKFVVEGFRLTSEAVTSDFKVELLLHTREFVGHPKHVALVQRCREKKIGIVEASAREFDSFTDTETSQGVAALVVQRHWRLQDARHVGEGPEVIVAFDSVSDPGNVGTMIRTADWFGVSAILMGQGSAELYNPKAVRSTMGSLFHLPILTNVKLGDLLEKLRPSGYTVIAADVQGRSSYDAIVRPEKTVIIFGNEAHGLSSEISGQIDYRAAIKRIGSAESLNVGVACGILLAYFCAR
jgi:TrmH family RNA methyltransferase